MNTGHQKYLSRFDNTCFRTFPSKLSPLLAYITSCLHLWLYASFNVIPYPSHPLFTLILNNIQLIYIDNWMTNIDILYIFTHFFFRFVLFSIRFWKEQCKDSYRKIRACNESLDNRNAFLKGIQVQQFSCKREKNNEIIVVCSKNGRDHVVREGVKLPLNNLGVNFSALSIPFMKFLHLFKAKTRGRKGFFDSKSFANGAILFIYSTGPSDIWHREVNKRSLRQINQSTTWSELCRLIPEVWKFKNDSADIWLDSAAVCPIPTCWNTIALNTAALKRPGENTDTDVL